jgi:hypothetical protein
VEPSSGDTLTILNNIYSKDTQQDAFFKDDLVFIFMIVKLINSAGRTFITFFRSDENICISPKGIIRKIT